MYLYYNCTRAVKFSNSRQRLNFEEGGRSAILRRGGHLVHKIKNILDERRGGRFFDREEGGPLLYAFGGSYGGRDGGRRGGHFCMHLVRVMERG